MRVRRVWIAVSRVPSTDVLFVFINVNVETDV